MTRERVGGGGPVTTGKGVAGLAENPGRCGGEVVEICR